MTPDTEGPSSFLNVQKGEQCGVNDNLKKPEL